MGYAALAPYSDHYMVGLFVPKPVDLGPHHWQFPEDLLPQEEFALQASLIFNCFDKSHLINSWETLKLHFQEKAQ